MVRKRRDTARVNPTAVSGGGLSGLYSRASSSPPLHHGGSRRRLRTNTLPRRSWRRGEELESKMMMMGEGAHAPPWQQHVASPVSGVEGGGGRESEVVAAPYHLLDALRHYLPSNEAAAAEDEEEAAAVAAAVDAYACDEFRMYEFKVRRPSPVTVTTASGATVIVEPLDLGLIEEEQPMERVESGRALREKVFERLSKEATVSTDAATAAAAAGVAPDVGWVSDLIN
uniref:Uncharacterized protein n=1 Tax=Oryza barthii TaxID=65489 RepID=A0A0D3G469_9ORYZ